MLASQPISDSHSRVRWEGLREALAKRYANAAEAYVAMGGRAGGEISLQQLERSLQDLNARVLGLRRGSTSVRSVDVHAILADVERSFQSGISFQQFASALSWEDKKPDVIRSKEMIASRVLVGAPGAALRMSRENDHPAAGRGAQPSAKRPASPAGRSPGGEGARDPRSLVFPDWKGKKWTGSRAPPAHFMQQQRRATALHSAVSQDKNAKLLKNLNLGAKMDSIEAAEAKLNRLVQSDEAHRAHQQEINDAAKATPVQHLIRTPKEPPRVSPTAVRQPSSPPAYLPTRPKSPIDKAEMVQNAGIAMSSKAAELSDRLASLNSTVFQQKLSLAETEKNILLKERQELQAQIRQLNQSQKQAQADMQNKMTDQFGKAMKETFEQIKDVMKSIQGSDKKDLASLNEAFEQNFRKQLMYYADYTPQSTLLAHRTSRYGPINIDLHNFLDSVISVRSETEGKQGNGFFFNVYDTVEKMSSAQMRQCRDHVDAGNLHSDQSPFLLNIINSVQYNPVISWYTVDSHNFPNAGSVGALARLDPINGNDYVDDFLLELLIAIRLNQIFPVGLEPNGGHSLLGSIMPIFFGGERPRDESRTHAAFPREKLHLLSSKPSIETARKAAELLHTVGVSTPEHFLRLSVREAVGKIMDCPGIWMDKYESKSDAQNEAAKMIIGLARAERAALSAKSVDEQRDPPLALAEDISFDQPEVEDEDSGDEDDEFTQARKREQREQQKARVEERRKRAVERQREEYHVFLEAEEKKKACRDQFETCIRALGLDDQAKNLADSALKARGLKLEEFKQTQKQDAEDPDAAQKKKLEKAMRRFARTEGLLKKQAFENWVHDTTAIKNFKSKLGYRSNLRHSFFERWATFYDQCLGSRAECVRTRSKKDRLLLEEKWNDWREMMEEEIERNEEQAVDTTDPAHLAMLLSKLQEAVVETHQKHSCLLEMRQDEEIMSTLLQKLSPKACDALRDAGIAKMEQLMHAAKCEDGKIGDKGREELKQYGIPDADIKRIEMFLDNPVSFELGGLAQPAGDFEQKQQELFDEMSKLREKLNLKRDKLMEEFPDDTVHSPDVEPVAGQQKDPNLGVLHELLGALGVAEPELRQEAATEDDAASPEDELEGQEEQTQRDKDTRDYIAKLRNEGDANKTALQALSFTLGEVGENMNDKAVTDPDTENLKKSLGDKFETMERTMGIFVQAMTRARNLLDNDPAEDEASTNSAELSDGKPAGEAFERAEDMSLGTLTTAEADVQKLAQDVERRSKQADALENENMLLKQQMESLRAVRVLPPPSKAALPLQGRKNSPKHWSAEIADPELAQKYQQLDDDEDASFFADLSTHGEGGSALEDKYLDTAALQKMLGNEAKPTNLAWSLNAVDGSTPLTQSSLFDALLEEKIGRGRSALADQIMRTQQELDEVMQDVSDKELSVQKFHEEFQALQTTGAKSLRPPITRTQLEEQVRSKERDWRLAEASLKGSRERQEALESLKSQLEVQHEALDLRKELDGLDRKMSDEVAASAEELTGLLDAQELDPTPEIAERIAYSRDKVKRIEESWKLKRNLRVKEIEIEIMGQKMAEDEASLQSDVAKSKGVYANNASDARGELSKALQMMEDSVTNTARGRCRPEVLASMTAVQKLREAVNRNKQEASKKQQEQRNDILTRQKEARQKKEEDETQKEQEEVLRQKRSTTDLDHRHERIEALKRELEKKKDQMIKDAQNSLEDAEAAAAAADEDGAFSKMHIQKVDRSRRHAKSFVKDAQGIYEELVGSDESAAQRHKVEIERLAAVAKKVDDAEGFLVERTKEARALTDALLKKDLRKMSKEDTFADEVKNVREEAESLLQGLDELCAVEDVAKVKSRELTGAEEKLRLGWTRLKPKLDDAIYNQLTVGDKSLDVVQAALASGKPGALSTAMQEIAKAEAAYKVPV